MVYVISNIQLKPENEIRVDENSVFLSGWLGLLYIPNGIHNT